MMGSFIRLLVFALLCLIVATAVMLIFKFTTSFNYEWQTAAFVMVVYCLINPFLMGSNDNVKKFLLRSFYVFIALFLDLSILSGLVSWQPIQHVWQNILPLLLATAFFPLSWIFRIIFK